MTKDTNWKIARNEAAVRAFLKGWDDRDVEACMALVTDHMCYLNQPLEAIRGKANVRKMIASIFAPAKKVEFKLINVFGHGNQVITERLDQWDWNGSGTWQLKLPVCGMFELTEDGKIAEWREYYDNQHWSKYGGPSLEL
ncbi:MAG: nuclear transport factor 2 family protein [Gammaproteobacteria bacterium]|nr:nuclear transport factor 2 family protein [Gammaproteobacteria bacterium]